MAGGEKKFELKIRNFLSEHGVYECGTPKQDMSKPVRGWYFKHWGGGYSKSGIPDLICNINGHFVSIEVKDTKGRSSELQKRNTIMINQGGGIGIIVYPEGFEELKQMISALLRIRNPILEAVKHFSTTKCNILTE